MSKSLRFPLLLAFLLTLAATAACTPAPSERCRFDPTACGGNVGGACHTDDDCFHGQCCTDGANCAGGMCTLPCSVDTECPDFMACEHNICFFACDADTDCATGQTCEHHDGNRGVCEWP